MKCEACRKAITGAYIKSGKKFYHQEHFICAYCRKAIGAGSIVHENKNYHKECFFNNIALKCSLCSKVITGKYAKDFWGNLYHFEHDGRVPQCNYCTRYISNKLTGGYKKYDDGRIVCNICSRTAITGNQPALKNLEHTREILIKYGIKVEKKSHGLSLVNKHGLKKVSEKKIMKEQTGYTYYKMRTVNNKVDFFKLDIYILIGLPEMHFIMTVAHELMHVWQYLNAPLNNNPALCEGSCNYAAYLVIKTFKSKESDYLIYNMLNNRDKVYGAGFKRVSAFVKKNGIRNWIDYLKKNKNFPLGY